MLIILKKNFIMISINAKLDDKISVVEIDPDVTVSVLKSKLIEDAKTIEEVYEPYLIKEGFMQRTSRGRIALDKAYKYLNIINPNNNQTDIFDRKE